MKERNQKQKLCGFKKVARITLMCSLELSMQSEYFLTYFLNSKVMTSMTMIMTVYNH